MTESMLTGRFIFQTNPLAQRTPIEDNRGFFSRFFCAGEFRDAGFTKNVAQINHSFTQNKGTVRGLHFQYPPHTEVRVVSCLRGEVFDVAIDIRKNSPTFLKWHSEILSAANQKSLLVPEGFAHGFQTLSEDCELIYIHSVDFCFEASGALNCIDPKVGIIWPLPITNISDRDVHHSLIADDFEGVII